MADVFSVPPPLRTFFAYFPLYTYPRSPPFPNTAVSTPTIWVHPPRQPQDSPLSGDIECLKWQAYLALRGLTSISVRWDVSPDGCIDGQLPNLHTPEKDGGQLLAAHDIPLWTDSQVEEGDSLQGYRNQLAKDESSAWVSVLESKIYPALIVHKPDPSFLSSIISPLSTPATHKRLETTLVPPPAPFSGLSSLLPPYGTRVSTVTIDSQYREAISALSDRLGADTWFLDSDRPTSMDALLFAFMHTLVNSSETLRIEVVKRVNLTAWEQRVRSQVCAAFSPVNAA